MRRIILRWAILALIWEYEANTMPGSAKHPRSIREPDWLITLRGAIRFCESAMLTPWKHPTTRTFCFRARLVKEVWHRMFLIPVSQIHYVPGVETNTTRVSKRRLAATW